MVKSVHNANMNNT